MDAQHTKHVTYKLAYHFVWCPKYRNMSGPIRASSREKREERHTHVVILPEEACPTRIAL